MTESQIISTGTQATSSGLGSKPNGISQIQLPQQPGAWILCDNGYIYFNGPIIYNSNNYPSQLLAPDGSCLVQTNNGGDLELQSTDRVVLNAPRFIINGSPSSQAFIVYGQSKGENVCSEQFHVDWPDPDPSNPSALTIRGFGYPDFGMWFQNDAYNQPDNDFISLAGPNFQLHAPEGTVCEIQITFQLQYLFDGGTYPSTDQCIGLWCQDTSSIVAQSVVWYSFNDQKFKYCTMTTKFQLRCDGQGYQYMPFFSNQNHNQLQDTEIGGNIRSSIQFKFYPFLAY